MAIRVFKWSWLAIAVLVVAGCAGKDADEDSGPPAARGVSLPSNTTMGAVELVVRDRDEVQGYYTDALGLSVIETAKTQTTLGYGDEPLVRLIEDADAPTRQDADAGLYHVALLYDDAAALANTVVRVSQQAPQSYQGSADHGVSLAFYFADPAGNGIELYVDRPREEWTWVDGEVVMGSAGLDVNAFVQENATSSQVQDGGVGHLHLAVGELGQAEAFYSQTLGFDVTARSDGALFMSAGGYHHHLAVNTWASAGAAARPAGQQGLGRVRIEVPDAAARERISDRLAADGYRADVVDEVLVTADPWNNMVEIAVAGDVESRS